MNVDYLAKVLLIALTLISITIRAEVIELTPAGLADFLETHNNSVVQFTSPDTKCGYCSGADTAFDQFAETNTGEFTFSRVQWSPWIKTPKVLEKQFHVIALPMHICYREGKKVNELFGALQTTDSRIVERFTKTCFKDHVGAE